jgi:hypothetical protein
VLHRSPRWDRSDADQNAGAGQQARQLQFSFIEIELYLDSGGTARIRISEITS